jgi:hypothetical protein
MTQQRKRPFSHDSRQAQHSGSSSLECPSHLLHVNMHEDGYFGFNPANLSMIWIKTKTPVFVHIDMRSPQPGVIFFLSSSRRWSVQLEGFRDALTEVTELRASFEVVLAASESQVLEPLHCLQQYLWRRSFHEEGRFLGIETSQSWSVDSGSTGGEPGGGCSGSGIQGSGNPLYAAYDL